MTIQGNYVGGLIPSAEQVGAFSKDELIPLANGGTNRDLSEITPHAIIRAASNSTALLSTPTDNGAFYATTANGAAKFGTLPIAQGGTGATTAAAALIALGAAPADSVGTNKVFKKLTDIGITTFPTTMSTVASKMPNNSTLILDSRDIVSGGDNEISDFGAIGAGTYMIMRGNTTSRLQLLHIYGAATATTSYIEVGNYAVTPNTVSWVRALDNADATYAKASANNNYHTAYFTKIGRFVSCALLPKTTNTTAVYQEDITIPSGYAPSANTTFSIYSDTSKNAGGNGSAAVIAYKNGVLRVSSNGGISVAEASKTYCWVTA